MKPFQLIVATVLLALCIIYFWANNIAAALAWGTALVFAVVLIGNSIENQPD